MDEIITLAEMEERHPSEWILVADPQLDDTFEVIQGRVACHSKDRDEVYQRAIDLKLKDSAFLYTGKIPEGTAVIL